MTSLTPLLLELWYFLFLTKFKQWRIKRKGKVGIRLSTLNKDRDFRNRMVDEFLE